MTPTALLLDDERNSEAVESLRLFQNIVTVRSVAAFKEHITSKGLPDFIAFDFYLGMGLPTGYDAAHFLCQHCMDNKLALPKWKVHSSSKEGALDIERLLLNFRRFKDTGAVPDVRMKHEREY